MMLNSPKRLLEENTNIYIFSFLEPSSRVHEKLKSILIKGWDGLYCGVRSKTVNLSVRIKSFHFIYVGRPMSILSCSLGNPSCSSRRQVIPPSANEEKFVSNCNNISLHLPASKQLGKLYLQI